MIIFTSEDTRKDTTTYEYTVLHIHTKNVNQYLLYSECDRNFSMKQGHGECTLACKFGLILLHSISLMEVKQSKGVCVIVFLILFQQD